MAAPKLLPWSVQATLHKLRLAVHSLPAVATARLWLLNSVAILKLSLALVLVCFLDFAVS